MGTGRAGGHIEPPSPARAGPPVGGADTLDEVGAYLLEATIRSGALNPTRAEKIRGWLAKYIGQQSLFGLTLHADALRADAPRITSGLLPFLEETLARLSETGVKGIFLVLDEINGITANPKFAHFVKSLVDSNALSRKPVPLLLMLCGVEERRREMIRHHQPIERVFDVVEIEPMSAEETREFFRRAFDSVRMQVEPAALETMTSWSAGFPKVMHLIGDAAFWIDRDGSIDEADAFSATLAAAEEVGRKYVDQQVLKALRSKDYRSILAKIAKTGLDMQFSRKEVAAGLTEGERRKFGNFLQKMKRLGVLRPGDNTGEWVFVMRMVRLFIWLDSHRAESRPQAARPS